MIDFAFQKTCYNEQESFTFVGVNLLRYDMECQSLPIPHISGAEIPLLFRGI
jgi:hypothetical protein